MLRHPPMYPSNLMHKYKTQIAYTLLDITLQIVSWNHFDQQEQQKREDIFSWSQT